MAKDVERRPRMWTSGKDGGSFVIVKRVNVSQTDLKKSFRKRSPTPLK